MNITLKKIILTYLYFTFILNNQVSFGQESKYKEELITFYSVDLGYATTIQKALNHCGCAEFTTHKNSLGNTNAKIDLKGRREIIIYILVVYETKSSLFSILYSDSGKYNLLIYNYNTKQFTYYEFAVVIGSTSMVDYNNYKMFFIEFVDHQSFIIDNYGHPLDLKRHLIISENTLTGELKDILIELNKIYQIYNNETKDYSIKIKEYDIEIKHKKDILYLQRSERKTSKKDYFIFDNGKFIKTDKEPN